MVEGTWLPGHTGGGCMDSELPTGVVVTQMDRGYSMARGSGWVSG